MTRSPNTIKELVIAKLRSLQHESIWGVAIRTFFDSRDGQPLDAEYNDLLDAEYNDLIIQLRGQIADNEALMTKILGDELLYLLKYPNL
jgi:hypothetical protein